MESTLKPEVLDQTERRVTQLEMEAASLSRKAAGRKQRGEGGRVVRCGVASEEEPV
jgi:hypothetical protein